MSARSPRQLEAFAAVVTELRSGWAAEKLSRS